MFLRIATKHIRLCCMCLTRQLIEWTQAILRHGKISGLRVATKQTLILWLHKHTGVGDLSPVCPPRLLCKSVQPLCCLVLLQLPVARVRKEMNPLTSSVASSSSRTGWFASRLALVPWAYGGLVGVAGVFWVKRFFFTGTGTFYPS
ncbi:hypothetical protein BRADI_3g21333v3 [Brachypodium distachyon]|uniref:Uncharacterized protein n=1 Tax=Brachypodium distachyon TaxID=15368 RepID=A0A2K2CYM0_BRADI|nr:hypothetical protein BRADI_3g21333v3 [Brachypodium distachyon]